MEHHLSALLQLHLHSQLNTWLQWIGPRQLQDETRNVYGWGLGATYIRDLTVFWAVKVNAGSSVLCQVRGMILNLSGDHVLSTSGMKVIDLCHFTIDEWWKMQVPYMGQITKVRLSCFTWFCYHLIAKPGNKTATPSWPDPYLLLKSSVQNRLLASLSAGLDLVRIIQWQQCSLQLVGSPYCLLGSGGRRTEISGYKVTELILGLRPANERWRYFVTTSPIGWVAGLGSSTFRSTWVKYKYFFIFASTNSKYSEYLEDIKYFFNQVQVKYKYFGNKQ